MNSSIVTEKNVADPWTLSDYERELLQDIIDTMVNLCLHGTCEVNTIYEWKTSGKS
jgi:hypothetical protein